jgi:hypothetical protein
LHVDKFNEDYLIPLPDVKVTGILSGSPYPELQGSHTIVSSSGYRAVIDFSGKRFLGFAGQKNHVHAAVFGPDDEKNKHALFTIEGNWAESFDILDSSGKKMETYSVSSALASEFRTLPMEKQDPWESRKAWNGVISAVNRGDMQGIANVSFRLAGHPLTLSLAHV